MLSLINYFCYSCCVVVESCLTLCVSMDCSTTDSSVLYYLGVSSNSCSLSWWCYSTITSSAVPWSCPQSFPVSGFFPMSQLFTSGGQSTGASASASALPMNTQDWLPLGLTGLISLQSKGLSRVFSNTTVQKINSLVLSLLYGPTFTSVHDHWKNHRFEYIDPCWQSEISDFKYAV